MYTDSCMHKQAYIHTSKQISKACTHTHTRVRAHTHTQVKLHTYSKVLPLCWQTLWPMHTSTNPTKFIAKLSSHPALGKYNIHNLLPASSVPLHHQERQSRAGTWMQMIEEPGRPEHWGGDCHISSSSAVLCSARLPEDNTCTRTSRTPRRSCRGEGTGGQWRGAWRGGVGGFLKGRFSSLSTQFLG